MIPKKIHFIYGLEENFGGKKFCFSHWAAIKSAIKMNPDFEIHFWYKYNPNNYYFDSLLNQIILHKIEPPEEIFNNKLFHVAHKTDVLRIQILTELGGIYLDIDTVCVKSFDPLLSNNFVMGYEEPIPNHIVGLCNAVMLAEEGAEFLKIWIDKFRTFRSKGRDEFWNEHAVKMPYQLALQRPDLITILPSEAFFYPSTSDQGIAQMFYLEQDFPNAYVHHLWESLSWGALSLINEYNFLHIRNSYTKIIKKILHNEVEELKTTRDNWIANEIDCKRAKLNLGCGTKRNISMINCDIYQNSAAELIFNLDENNWPIPNSSVEEVTLFSILEHIKNTETFFKELYRVCKNGAKISVLVPYPRHDWFLTDPTHVRSWHPESFSHLDKVKCLKWYFSGDAKTPLALYWNIDFRIEEFKIFSAGETAQIEINTLFGKEVDLNLANKYLNNVATDLNVTLIVFKHENLTV
jgi:hypothetical protein